MVTNLAAAGNGRRRFVVNSGHAAMADRQNHYTFVEEIRVDPSDDVPRLIYADFLEEWGDPRGELIRTQIELARRPVGDAARAPLERLEQQLLERHAESWLAPLRELGAEGVSIRCFQRGLIERAQVSAEQFLATGAELCRREPALHTLELRQPRPVLEQLAQVSLPAQITTLDLSANQLGPGDLATLRTAPWWGQLIELNLQFNDLGDAGVVQLATLAAPRLRRLRLGANRIGADGVLALAGAEFVRRLVALSLNVNLLGDPGAERLARVVPLVELEELDLASNRIGDVGGTALANSPHLDRLRRLTLRANQLDRPVWQAFAAHARWLGLELLDVRANRNTSDSVLDGFRTSVLR